MKLIGNEVLKIHPFECLSAALIENEVVFEHMWSLFFSNITVYHIFLNQDLFLKCVMLWGEFNLKLHTYCIKKQNKTKTASYCNHMQSSLTRH